MGLFSPPRCPGCGQKDRVVRNFSATSTKPWKCLRCIKNNREKDDLIERINRLESALKNKNQ